MSGQVGMAAVRQVLPQVMEGRAASGKRDRVQGLPGAGYGRGSAR
ncbi:hypothetical protein [Streptomyces sp. NPDC008141]